MTKRSDNVRVAGVTFGKRQQTLMGMRTVMKSGRPVSMVLCRDKENPADACAVKVLARWYQGKRLRRALIGYLPRETAAKAAQVMNGGGFVKVEDFSITDTKTIGVRLNLAWN